MNVSTRGSLETAGEWTHLYSNAANTLCSTDSIKGPLTAVWFRDIDLELPQRHGRGPSPLFHKGRLFAQGLDELIAVDAYNGRPLWRFEQQGILDALQRPTIWPERAVTGSNICIAGDSVFLRNRDRCFRIDAATGHVKATFKAPRVTRMASLQHGATSRAKTECCSDRPPTNSTSLRHGYVRADKHMQRQFSESTSLFAFDVDAGRLAWQYKAEHSIRHNAIAIGAGRVHLIDRALAVDDLLSRAPARRGDPPKTPPAGHAPGELITLDANTGKQTWEATEDIFGTVLAFSHRHNILLMCYQPTRFKLLFRSRRPDGSVSCERRLSGCGTRR